MTIHAHNVQISIENPDGSWNILSNDPVEGILFAIDRLSIPLLPLIDTHVEHTISILDSNWRPATEENIKQIIQYRLANGLEI